jgi:Bacterial HORMA domain family 1
MSQTRTASASQTYTVADIEEVVLNLKADLVMIADSTQGWTPEKARDYAHDVAVLAKAGYLKYVDVTLLSNSVEMKAVRFDVDTEAGSLTTSRPGGVLWPKVANPYLRIILGYTSDYTDTARDATKGKLKIGWTPTSDDTSHSSLTTSGGRNYASNSYGMQRKDWAA